MLRETSPVMERSCDTVFVALNVDHPYWQPAMALLEAAGGQRQFLALGAVYRFLTEPRRDYALDLVRRTLGWTVASPHDDRGAFPGCRPGGSRAPAARSGRI